MGYTTEFEGSFKLDKPLAPAHLAYLTKFSEVRHMSRYAKKVAKMSDKIRLAAELPIGCCGEFFVGGLGFKGCDSDESVIDINSPPITQPGLWCQWIPNKEGTEIEWDGVEKFYNYVAWLEYIIKMFLIPWGYVLNGEVDWEGEDRTDVGTIRVKNNKVEVF